jgi:hypothetical protein
MTHRQFVTWVEWEKDQWNIPDRRDNYLAAIAYEVRCANPRVSNPNALKPEQFKLKFEFRDDRPKNGSIPVWTKASILRANKAKAIITAYSDGRGNVSEEGKRLLSLLRNEARAEREKQRGGDRET